MKKILLLLILPIFAYAQTNQDESTPKPEVDQGENIQKKHDNQNRAKMDWIRNNPEEYRKMGGDPDAVLKADQVKKEKTPKPQLEKIPFDVEHSFVLQNISIVPVEDHILEADEAKEILDIVEQDYQVGKTFLQFDQNKGIRLTDHETMNIVGREKRYENDVIEWFFDNKDCQSCSKTILLNLEKESNNQLIYLMKSEDEKDHFSYRLTFIAH